jgi:hypothetical protein
MPPVGARLSVDDDGDDDDVARGDRGGGTAALATFMLAMFKQEGRQAVAQAID